MRHSDLINPADLHFAKFKTFSGLPSAITPNFADQLFASTDTNRIYRATGITQGALIELLAAPIGDGQPSGQNYSLISTFSGSPLAITPDSVNQLFAAIGTNKIYRSTGITQGALIELSPSPNAQQALVSGNNYPSFASPDFVGQKYYDQVTGILFFAKGLSLSDWRPVYDDTQINFNISGSAGMSNPLFDVYYSPEYPVNGYNFTNLIAAAIGTSNNIEMNVVARAGTGYYAIAPTFADSAVRVRCSISTIEHPLDNRPIFTMEELTGSFTANGQPISPQVLWFREFPKTPMLSGSPYLIQFEAERI